MDETYRGFGKQYLRATGHLEPMADVLIGVVSAKWFKMITRGDSLSELP